MISDRNSGAPTDRELRLTRKALVRLSARGKIASIAAEIVAGREADDQSKVSKPTFFVESEIKTACLGPQPAPTHFECSSAFNNIKPPDFKCDTNVTYGSECKTEGEFECHNDYDCPEGTGVFDCADFTCGNKSGGAGSFDCSTDGDFLCGGYDYECFDDFDCSADHAFACWDDHECNDDFTCSSPGDPGCSGNYNRPPNQGGPDTTAGDFLCGSHGGNSDEFDCNDDFDCSAGDQFECQESTNFDCGTGQSSDSFACDPAKFECDTDFDCRPVGNFSCPATTSYTAPSS